MNNLERHAPLTPLYLLATILNSLLSFFPWSKFSFISSWALISSWFLISFHPLKHAGLVTTDTALYVWDWKAISKGRYIAATLLTYDKWRPDRIAGAPSWRIDHLHSEPARHRSCIAAHYFRVLPSSQMHNCTHYAVEIPIDHRGGPRRKRQNNNTLFFLQIQHEWRRCHICCQRYSSKKIQAHSLCRCSYPTKCELSDIARSKR